MMQADQFDWSRVSEIGAYTIPMAFRLIGAQPTKLRSWIDGYSHSGAEPIIHRQIPRVGKKTVIGFLDLMEARFIRHFQTHGFSPQTIRKVSRARRRGFRGLRVQHQHVAHQRHILFARSDFGDRWTTGHPLRGCPCPSPSLSGDTSTYCPPHVPLSPSGSTIQTSLSQTLINPRLTNALRTRFQAFLKASSLSPSDNPPFRQ
jgi:hypothetical protein